MVASDSREHKKWIPGMKLARFHQTRIDKYNKIIILSHLLRREHQGFFFLGPQIPQEPIKGILTSHLTQFNKNEPLTQISKGETETRLSLPHHLSLNSFL